MRRRPFRNVARTVDGVYDTDDGTDEAEGAAEAAARITGRTVSTEHRHSGALVEVLLDDGRSAMVKRAEAPRAVRAEAAGLRWLADSGAVRVPAVYGEASPWLITELIPRGRPTTHSAHRFGRDLATLHASGAPAFGAPPPDGPEDAYIGRAPMRNLPGPNWPRWYAERRVLPYLRDAVDEGTIRSAEAADVERVCERLPELAGPAEPPARLHGDLWHGNVLWGREGTAWLIDPAAHGGHRESDLAMLSLFGCPFLDDVLDGYRRTAPLADGWEERVGLHQLFPLLVHAVLFGRGFAEQAVAVARTALAR